MPRLGIELFDDLCMNQVRKNLILSSAAVVRHYIMSKIALFDDPHMRQVAENMAMNLITIVNYYRRLDEERNKNQDDLLWCVAEDDGWNCNDK
jgi:hypothetical protein